MRIGGRRRLLADADQLLDGREGSGKHGCRRLADVADAEREDEAVQFGLAARVDRREQLVEAFIGALLAPQDFLARRALRGFALPRLRLAALEQGLLNFGTAVLQREDIGGGLEQSGIEEQVDVLGAEPLDIHRAARHEMAQRLHRLRRADQLARAAPAGILLAGLLVDLPRRRRTADRAGMREFVGHARRPGACRSRR